jgi:hypothetical protein
MQRSFDFTLRRGLIPRLGIALSALAALGTGFGAARAQTSSPVPSANSQPANPKMNHFVIIFRQGPRVLTEADLARRQQEVSAWARVQNAAGHQLEPRILAPDVVRPGAEANGNQGFGADAWPITALLFLEASDLAEAAKVADSHPAHRYGVSIEVRPWAVPSVSAIPEATVPGR